MNKLLCLNYTLDKRTKRGIPASCSYSYKNNKCKCDNCLNYKKQSRLKYISENKDKIKKTKSLYYQKNKKKIRKNQKVYEAKTKDKRKEYLKKYSLENKERIRRVKLEYARKHPEMDRNKNRRKRAIKKQNGFEKYTEFQVLELYGTNCYLCNMPIDMSANRKCGYAGWEKGLHIEHYIDIALGGPDTLENVRPSHAMCNLRKNPRGMV
jgi:hypothetical protein